MILVTDNSNHIKPILKESSILVSMYGLSFMIYDKTKNEKKFFEYLYELRNPAGIQTELKKIVQERDLDLSSFNQINLIHHNLLNTLLPETVFDENQLAVFIRQNIKLLPGDLLLYNSIPDFQLYNVYVAYRSIIDFFQTHNKVNNQHTASIFLNLVNKIKKSVKQPPVYEIYLNIFQKDFQIVIFKNDSLLLYNQFEYQNADEFLYYLFFVMETLEIKEKNSHIYVTGVEKENEVIQNLQDFTSQISIFPKRNPGRINNYMIDAY